MCWSAELPLASAKPIDQEGGGDVAGGVEESRRYVHDGVDNYQRGGEFRRDSKDGTNEYPAGQPAYRDGSYHEAGEDGDSHDLNSGIPRKPREGYRENNLDYTADDRTVLVKETILITQQMTEPSL